ncbi:translation initiation factor IF-3 [Candidatus Falkowbacteria bacterium]|uniref:Translation initiation factor IF-3 n=1 Tax=Candidatus Falkowbacteria bacterium CG10_big_fil_rev_8_21_14_0_10_37_18 TaxID=1974562 RepID=A0A2H0VAU0_9BACT|nr:translation initiation factor IF-3 [Candidatus Falkowbacteria bacterium]NCQ12926.1 translation initiation factor IF-3 [Candidatus Falkowbacteria bacterium]OIO06266.1 MAG: translation initiation factor IF-3 [Candidatus Falkowbacteria bacterium CG1_02_37_21]PIR95430.1 MAG: translation initiation factor IF-3 [Candidatus Falkowbacteria bacterium CG10_big_fil_rev_8_21_14_0_10_37_18]
MRIKFHRIERKEVPIFKANTQIKALEVFVIDEDNEALGQMTTEAALKLAEEAELDLVEVNPKANPPVVKIVNLGQLKYEREKQAHRQKTQQKKTETKSIRLSFRISEHDLSLRVSAAEKFLAKDNKVKVELILRGRERQYPQKAAALVRGFVSKLQANPELSVEAEQPLTNQGGRFTIILFNKK